MAAIRSTLFMTYAIVWSVFTAPLVVIAGPLLGGAVFTAGGLHGLAGLLLGLSLAGLAWCLWSARQPNRPGARTGSPPSL